MQLTLAQVGEILGVPGGAADVTASGYSIDSRTIQPNELFFAIRGPNFDGHDFVRTALEKGAVGAIVERDGASGGRLLYVESTLRALERLATEVRRRWGRPLVAVTGSAGKTTTKEMIAAVLETRLRVIKNEGNLNNQYGLPLSLLRLDTTHEAGVFELGMSHVGEIAALARIAAPDVGVVTCVAPVHLEFFESINGIAAAKRELVEALSAGGTAVLNADDAFVSRFGEAFAGRVVTFGVESAADFRATELQDGGVHGVEFAVRSAGDMVNVVVPLIGRHNVLNALAAIATGHVFGIAPSEAAAALAAYRPAKMRGEILEICGATVINDCYNSNPRALEFMLEALARTPTATPRRRIAVLGEMRELGPTSPDLHRAAGRKAARAADWLVAVAGDARYMVEGAIAAGLDPSRAAFFDDAPAAGEYVASMVQEGDVVLFKGSRGVRLEQALERLRIADCGLKRMNASDFRKRT